MFKLRKQEIMNPNFKKILDYDSFEKVQKSYIKYVIHSAVEKNFRIRLKGILCHCNKRLVYLNYFYTFLQGCQ